MNKTYNENISVDKLFKIGIDRVQIKCNDVAIDFDKFAYESVTYSLDSQTVGFSVIDLRTGEIKILREMEEIFPIDLSVAYSNVSDIRNGNVYFNIKKIRHTSDYICTVEFTLPRLVGEKVNHNVYNVHTFEAIEEALNNLKTLLGSRGIYINYDTTELYSIEVNNTITPEYETLTYENYKSSFELMEKVCKKESNPRIINISKDEKDSDCRTTKLKWSDDRANVKFYDKKKQVLSDLNILVDKELMRCELTLKYKAIRQNSIFKDKSAIECIKNLDELINQFNKHVNVLVDNAKSNLLQMSYDMLDALERGYYPKDSEEVVPYGANYTDINQLLLNAYDYIPCIENYLLACEHLYKAMNNQGKYARDVNKVIQNLSINNSKCLYIGHDLNYLFSSFLGADVDVFTSKNNTVRTTKVKNALKKIDYKNRK